MLLACTRSACDLTLIFSQTSTIVMLLSFWVLTFAVDRCRHVGSPWCFSFVILSNEPQLLTIEVKRAMCSFLCCIILPHTRLQ